MMYIVFGSGTQMMAYRVFSYKKLKQHFNSVTLYVVRSNKFHLLHGTLYIIPYLLLHVILI